MRESTSENLGDLEPEQLRAALHRAADIAADYLLNSARYRVLPNVAPGDVRAGLPPSPPNAGEAIDTILDDFHRQLEPNVTHWNHPGFLAYFSISASAPGVIGELLSAALNVNAMLWRTGPAATELEELVCDWLRQMLALPPEFKGHLNDTASIASLLGLAAAREHADQDIRRRGLLGRADQRPRTVYCSDQAHSSIDKAMITLGLGLDQLRRLPTNERFELEPETLAQAIADDRAAGLEPLAVVATAGTTSTTSVDPLRALAAICRREHVWYHIDAAYAGSAAICPEYRQLLDGLECCDSLVFNPHKWLFVPIDCSVMLVREPEVLKRAFSVVPEYLRTSEENVTNLMDYGVQLGRRFRALKLWMVIRTFGVNGLRERIRYHCALAQRFADHIAADERFEIAAPHPFSVVCFRGRFPNLGDDAARDQMNEKLLNLVNADGRFFLSHTKLSGRYTLRVAIGNLSTTADHLEQVWKLLCSAYAELSAR